MRIVCKVENVDRHWAGATDDQGEPAVPGKWETIYRATCRTGECGWTYEGWPKVAVDEQARWHRDSHRSAS